MKDYFGYKDKICVVTGASSGIGRATAEMLVDLGAQVYGMDVNPSPVEGLAGFVSVNLGDRASIDAAFGQLPETIDHFFGIAGVSGLRTGFEDTVIINFVSNKYMTETYLESRMVDGGSIGFITSNGGWGWENDGNLDQYLPLVTPRGWDATVEALKAMGLSRFPGMAGYSLSKMAMNYYVAYLQKTFAPRKIRVNAVLPAATQSGLTGEFGKAAGGEENLIQGAGYAGRVGQPEEMAGPLVFLCSAMASFVSGVIMPVDYGNSVEVTAQLRDHRATNFRERKKFILARMAQAQQQP